jgi:hypothetical protein
VKYNFCFFDSNLLFLVATLDGNSSTTTTTTTTTTTVSTPSKSSGVYFSIGKPGSSKAASTRNAKC